MTQVQPLMPELGRALLGALVSTLAFAAVLGGLASRLAWGRRAGIAVRLLAVGAMGCLIWLWSELGGGAFPPHEALLGWVGSASSVDSFRLGWFLDSLALSLALLVFARVAFAPLDAGRMRELPGHLGSAVGAAIALLGATLWTALVGLMVSVISAVIVYGAQWRQESAARQGVRQTFAWLLALGLLLVAGVGLVATQGSTDWSSVQAAQWATRELGLVLVALAVLLLGQSFPILGDNESGAPSRMGSLVLNPWLIGFWVFYRLLPPADAPAESRVALALGIGAVGAGICSGLTALSGLAQSTRDTRTSVSGSLWMSAATAGCLAVAMGAGRDAGALLLISVSLLAALFEGIATLTESSTEAQSPLGLKLVAIALGVLGSTLPPLIGGEAWARLLETIWDEPARLAGSLLLVTLLQTLFWRVILGLLWHNRTWRRGLLGYGVGLIPLALVLWIGWWEGAPFGGLSAVIADPYEHEQQLWAQATLAALAVVSAAIAAWLARSERGMGRVRRWIIDGYGLKSAYARAEAALRELGRRQAQWLEDGVYGAGVLAALGRSAQRVAGRSQAMGARADEGFARGVGRVVRVSAKSLQLIQNGDARWYLVFAVGAGIGVLLNFWR